MNVLAWFATIVPVLVITTIATMIATKSKIIQDALTRYGWANLILLLGLLAIAMATMFIAGLRLHKRSKPIKYDPQ